MRLAAASVLLLVTLAACAQAQEPPGYGIGAPWPQPVIDSSDVIRNQVTVVLGDSLSEDRASVVIDSIAASLRASVKLRAHSLFIEYTFRWPGGMFFDQDTLITHLKAIPQIEEVWPGVLVGPPEGFRIQPADTSSRLR